MIEKNYTVIALITTGFSPPLSHIIEIAAIKIHDGEEIKRYQTLVKPPKKIPYVIECLTEINDEMVKNSPTFDEIIGDVKNFFEDDILIGHNLKIDIKFLPDFKNNFIDTLQIALKLIPNLKSVGYGLKDLCGYFKIPPPLNYRAMDFCLSTEKIFKLLQLKNPD